MGNRFFWSLGLMLVILTLIGHGTVEVKAIATPPERHDAFYERLLEAGLAAWHVGDVTALDEFYAQDVVRHRPPLPDTLGLDTMKIGIWGGRAQFTDLHVAVDGAIYQGDSLVRWGGVQRTVWGCEVVETWVWCTWDQFEGKKAVEEWDYSVLVAYGKATPVPAGPSVSIGEMLAPSESDAAFYERWIESTLAAFNEGDLDALDRFYAQDFVRQEPPNPGVVGLASFKEYILTTRNNYPDLRMTKNGSTIAQGEFTAIRGTAKGTSSSGEVDTYEWCAITRWQDKKAVEEWVYSVLAPSQGEE